MAFEVVILVCDVLVSIVIKCKEFKKNRKIGPIKKEKDSHLCWYWIRNTTIINSESEPLVTANSPSMKNRVNSIFSDEKKIQKIEKNKKSRFMKFKEVPEDSSTPKKQKRKMRINIPKRQKQKKEFDEKNMEKIRLKKLN